MGYESKLFIVEKSQRTMRRPTDGEIISIEGELMEDGRTMFYSSYIGCFDLCAAYRVSNTMRDYPITDSYFYCCDGNERILYDEYDNPLREIPLADAIMIIEDATIDSDYRRLKPCLALLKSLYDEKEKWGEIVVLHYGY